MATSKLAHEQHFCLQVVARLLQTKRTGLRRQAGQHLTSLTDFDTSEGPDSFEQRAVTYSQGHRVLLRESETEAAVRRLCSLATLHYVWFSNGHSLFGFSDEYDSSRWMQLPISYFHTLLSSFLHYHHSKFRHALTSPGGSSLPISMYSSLSGLFNSFI